jgi:hypothetical protein
MMRNDYGDRGRPGHHHRTREDFLNFLRHYPDALDDLEPVFDESGEQQAGLEPEAWEEALKFRRAMITHPINPGTLIEYWSRRSRWLLIAPGSAALFSLCGNVLSWLPVLLVALQCPATGTMRMPSIVIPTFLTLFFFSLMFFYWLDWRNDYFVHYRQPHHPQRVPSYAGQYRPDGTDDARLTRYKVSKSKSRISSPTLLNIGAVRITTAAQSGVLYFDYLDDPIVVRDTISRLRQLVRELDAGREQATLRGILEEHFQAAEAVKEVVPEEDEVYPAFKRNLSWLQRLRERFAHG